MQQETDLERALTQGEPVEIEANPRGGVNSSYEVRLDNGVEAIFEPLSGVDQRLAARYGGTAALRL